MAEVVIKDCYLDKNGLCDYLSLSRRSVEKYEQSGLPYYRLDRKHLYKVSEIDEWIQRYSHSAQDVRGVIDQICTGAHDHLS